jgi:hypothetical protein
VLATSALGAAAEPSSEQKPAVAADLLAHGIMPESRRRALRRSVLADVVTPCFAALAHSAEHAEQRPAQRVAGTALST